MKTSWENKINLVVKFQRPCMFQPGELEQHNAHSRLLRAWCDAIVDLSFHVARAPVQR